eukprot:4190760-Amphidinium_carterae.2
MDHVPERRLIHVRGMFQVSQTIWEFNVLNRDGKLVCPSMTIDVASNAPFVHRGLHKLNQWGLPIR